MIAPLRARASAPGKVNLFFEVGPRLADGYHTVASVYLALDLRDSVTVTAAPAWKISVTGGLPAEQLSAVPTDESNLVVRAAKWLAAKAGLEAPQPVHFEIEKNIPVAGGMGGGSADAAATLLALNKLWGLGFSLEELIGSSVELGADVPFALLGNCAEGLGRGEQLTPFNLGTQLHLVMVPASFGLSTPAVYQMLDQLRGSVAEFWPEPKVSADFERALLDGDLVGLIANFKNELEAPAIELAESLRSALELGRELGAMKSFISGSGPTTAHLVDSADSSRKLAANFKDQNVLAYATSGPAAGARLENI